MLQYKLDQTRTRPCTFLLTRAAFLASHLFVIFVLIHQAAEAENNGETNGNGVAGEGDPADAEKAKELSHEEQQSKKRL